MKNQVNEEQNPSSIEHGGERQSVALDAMKRAVEAVMANHNERARLSNFKKCGCEDCWILGEALVVKG